MGKISLAELGVGTKVYDGKIVMIFCLETNISQKILLQKIIF